MSLPDEEALMGQRVFEQALDVWIKPDIERRERAGALKLPFYLNAAQVIMPSPREKKPDYVRLNEEVRAQIRVKASRAIEKGEFVFNQDVEEVSAIRLIEDDETNAGHMTALNIGGHWVIGFDFRRDKSHVTGLLKKAREYYGSAKLCFERNLLGPAVDDLFAAAELGAKAELLLFGSYPYNKPKDHGVLRGRYAKWVGLGNAPREGNTALNELSRLRSAARYGEEQLRIPSQANLMKSVDKMLLHGEKRLGESG